MTVVPADRTATDSLSGIDIVTATIDNGDPIDTTGLGPKSFNSTATDHADNTTSLTHTYEVVRLNVQIYIKPGSDPNSLNQGSKVKIPVGLFTDTYQGVGFDTATIGWSTVVFAGAFALDRRPTARRSSMIGSAVDNSSI